MKAWKLVCSEKKRFEKVSFGLDMWGVVSWKIKALGKQQRTLTIDQMGGRDLGC
jgi:hypothetical protein